jgi:hypothetical protein
MALDSMTYISTCPKELRYEICMTLTNSTAIGVLILITAIPLLTSASNADCEGTNILQRIFSTAVFTVNPK